MSVSTQSVPRWRRWEQRFMSARDYAHPLHEVTFTVTFESPSGVQHTVDGFWDGDTTWRARFAPDEVGEWTFHTTCSDTNNAGLHGQAGRFTCSAPQDQTRFDRHGPVRLSENRRYLAHADGTPFLWLADTAWNGPLLATEAEWAQYLQARAQQGFTALQWVATQWRTAPDGDRDGQRAFSGHERIEINPAFFQRLDGMVDAMNVAGLLSAPVLLWAIAGDENPGYTLLEDQAILLERYMVARWGANQVLWILNGDGDYRGEQAERWRRIGRAVFGERPHAPVTLHPGGMQWVSDEFRDEQWLDIIGYQSGHGDDDATLRWLTNGPPATDWQTDPPRPHINLEPPYEDHIAYQSRERIDVHIVRRALYWSMLVTPTAGVTYGGHGIWGWDDGSGPPVAHPHTGTPKPWQEALYLPAAKQIAHVAAIFGTLDWWRLRPAPELLAEQPGDAEPSRYIAAARAEQGEQAVVYTPVAQPIVLHLDSLRAAARAEQGEQAVVYTPVAQPIVLHLDSLRSDLQSLWFNPATGERAAAASSGSPQHATFEPPAAGDWVLVFS